MNTYLGDSEYEKIGGPTPVVTIDFIIRSQDGRVLLACRNDEPAKNTYFVPGCRVRKNETFKAVAKRLRSQIGIKEDFTEPRLLGTYEQFYPQTSAEEEDSDSHYVVLVYEVCVANEITFGSSENYSRFDWRSEADAVRSPDVHKNAKEYLRKAGIQLDLQYNVVAARRNTFNTMLWQTPALSLTAVAFLLNVAGNKSAYWESRVATCFLATFVSIFTWQLFVRHRKMEERDSRLLEEFERRSRHLGYVSTTSKLDRPKGNFSFNPAEWSSYAAWHFLFVLFFSASLILCWFNLFVWRGNQHAGKVSPAQAVQGENLTNSNNSIVPSGPSK